MLFAQSDCLLLAVGLACAGDSDLLNENQLLDRHQYLFDNWHDDGVTFLTNPRDGITFNWSIHRTALNLNLIAPQDLIDQLLSGLDPFCNPDTTAVDPGFSDLQTLFDDGQSTRIPVGLPLRIFFGHVHSG